MKPSKPKYLRLGLSFGIAVAVCIWGLAQVEALNLVLLQKRLLWPLTRLMFFISIGLIVGQVIEASGWTKALASVAAPFFRFGNMAPQCSAAFTTAFVSGAAANAMLVDFYKDDKICKRELFLANFVNQLPAYFLHLPTTFFIIVPLTGWAGGGYLLVTFVAVLIRTAFLLLYGHLSPSIALCDLKAETLEAPFKGKKAALSFWRSIRAKFITRLVNIATFVVPIYVFIFIVNALGFFDWARQAMAQYVVTTIMPVESLSLVVLSFAAEFTSGFAAAGALLEAGVLTTKQTVVALLVGNIIAFPIRALRHQLPRYMGIFAPKMGSQLLLMGQGLRVGSIIFVGLIYYWVF
jgi:hypothetical protein